MGLSANFNKHKNGAGIGDKRRDGKHENCDCCGFVPALESTTKTAVSRLQETLALLPEYQQASVHAHLHGEFHRRADITGRM
jgi:hypothetical protein